MAAQKKSPTGKVTYTLSKRDKEIQAEAESLVGDLKSHKLSATWLKVKLGLFFIKIKKEKKKDFYSVIIESMFPKKEVQRCMKAALKSDVDFKEAMKTTGSAKDVAERVKALIVDERFSKFKEESDISEIHDLTFSKLEKMKKLSPKKWDEVVAGIDKPYADMLIQEAKDKEEATDKLVASKKPKGMKKVDYEKLVKSGLYTAIHDIHDYRVLNTKLEKEVETLDTELKILKEQEQEMKIQLARFEGMMSVSGNLKGMDISQEHQDA